MATRKKRPASRSSRSSSGKGMTFSSILLGLIIGLSVAAVAAFMIMRSPSPIQDHRQPTPGQTDPLSGLIQSRTDRPMIDPNAWMNSDGSINSAQQPPARQKIEPLPPLIGIPENAADMPFTAGDALTPTPTPAKPATKADDDQIASLINTLPEDKPAAAPARRSAAEAAVKTAPPAAGSKSTASSTTNTASPAANQTGSSGPRYLQVGSYRDEKEADAFRARMIMMGFNVQIQKARVNNMDVNRVRIGPFNSEQEIRESRAQLSGAKINSTIVR